MKFNERVGTTAGTIILVIIAATVCVFVWIYEKNQNEIVVKKFGTMQGAILNKDVDRKELQDSDTGSGELTGAWQVYTDSKFGFALQYPKEYAVHKYLPPCSSKKDDMYGENIIIRNDKLSSSHSTSKEGIADFYLFVNDPKDACIINAYSSIGSPQAQMPKLLGSEDITVNEYAVLKRTYAHLDPEGKPLAYHFSTWRFQRDGTYYTLLYNNGVIANSESQEKLFEKLLSTFKFLEK